MQNQPPSITADVILDRLSTAINIKKKADIEIDECKAILTMMRKEQLIGNEVEHPDLKLTWTTRSSWQYSAAVKELQDMEKIDGIATKKITESWTAKPVTPKF